MTRVLLTGVAGFAGSHLVEHIQANTDWDIVGLASFRHKGDPARMDVGDPNRLTLHYADLAGPLSPRLIDRIGPIDYIINAAAESHVDRSIEQPRPFIENNVNVVLTMLEYARLVKPKAFIQVSTDEVYGPVAAPHSFPEWSPIMPSNPYSASKAAQEAIAYSYWRTYGVPVVITNCMNMFGERQDPEKMVPLVIRSVLDGKAVPIHVGLDGKPGSRSYLHARNHADALLFILGRDPRLYDPADDSSCLDRFNIAGDAELNNLEIAEAVAELAGRELVYSLETFHATRPGHDLRYALDGRKLLNAGWKPPVDLSESLARTVEWTIANPEWSL